MSVNPFRIGSEYTVNDFQVCEEKKLWNLGLYIVELLFHIFEI